ncbi:MAG: hypothetical protein IPL46_31825 [Saprospiraceae bacterium]|nr:hypothetical protein [Saprospiraceae bacterium]
MKQMLLLLVLLLTILELSFAQELYHWEDSVKVISQEIMLSDKWTARAASLDKMPSALAQALDQDGSFDLTFDSARIAIVYAPDSSFRIMTGQAVLQNEDIKYYGLLQQKSDERNPIFFIDNSYNLIDIENDVLSAETWNGAVYYNLRSFRYENKDFFLVFGFAAKSLFENSKVTEVLYFEDGQPKFGAPVFFNDEGETKSRISIMYSADVGARMNYDTTLQMIIYDHLIPMKSPYKERQVVMVPDGSYCGYVLGVEHEGWTYVDKLFTEILTEAPREKPVLDLEKGQDIFGRSKKN